MDLGTTEAKTKKKTKILNLCEQSIAKHNTYIKRLKKKHPCQLPLNQKF